jgi:cell wall-associated NlpC family hydrolase
MRFQVKWFAMAVVVVLSVQWVNAAGALDAGASGVPLVRFTHPVRAAVVRQASSETQRQALAGEDDIIFIPKGDGGIHYRGDQPGSEMLPQGPAAFAVDRFGEFWLLDTVSGHVLHLSRGGKIVGNFDKSGELMQPIAIAVGRVGASKRDGFAVLDSGITTPRVLQYDRRGAKVSETPLPLDWAGSIHQISLNDDGSFDVFVVAGDSGRYHFFSRRGRTTYARVADLGYAGPDEDLAPGLTVAPVDPDNHVMEQHLLHVAADGERLIRVGEIAGDKQGNIYVDVTVRRLRADGTSSVARIPVREQYVPVEGNDGIATDPRTDDVYMLVTREDGVAIRRLEFVDHLEPLPPIDQPRIVSAMMIPHAAAASLNTCSMIAVGNDYCSSATWVPTCAVANDTSSIGRTKPSYMSSAGYYGVPYSWGGFDNRPNFAVHMSGATTTNHYKAGDVDETQQISYTGTGPTNWTGKPFFGVDCSGFISRAWNLTSKRSTTTLLDYVSGGTLTTFQQGDIMDYAGHHVMMYIDAATSPTSTGYYRYEEARGIPYGVELTTHQLSSLYAGGYKHYRYAGAVANACCVTVTSCPH